MGVDTQNLLAARRLMVAEDLYAAQRKSKGMGKQLSLKDAWAADEAKFSLEGQQATSGQSTTPTTGLDTRVRLSDLQQQLRAAAAAPADTNPAPAPAGQTAVAIAAAGVQVTQTDTEINLDLKAWAPVSGLVVRSPNLAETDRYAFQFQDGATFRILDKWSGLSTTIWGDPHVDTSDQPGANNGNFSDLTGSNSQTSMDLQDGTRVTFTAPDNGLIQAVDIYQGSQHLHGVGAGADGFTPDTGLFASQVQADSGARPPAGDVVHAGGDGNDWYDAAGHLVWGQTTGTAPTGPAALLTLSYTQTTTQVTATQTIERWG